jgi:hypothetical protein
VVVHARKDANSIALCGAGRAPWTTKRSDVTCLKCKEEVERRLREKRR